MWAEKLGDETFVTIVRPYVLHHRVGIARSSDIREPHPVLGCRVHADAAAVLHAAKAKRIRIATALFAGFQHCLIPPLAFVLQSFLVFAIGYLPLFFLPRHLSFFSLCLAPLLLSFFFLLVFLFSFLLTS